MPELSRRSALGTAAALAAAAGTQALAAPSADAAAHAHEASGHSPAPAAPAAPASFDEVYKGRRIQGRTAGGHHQHHGGGYAVFIDGVELHVMRNADGSWISVVSHYDPVPSPRAAARAAVDELQGARLLPFPAN
ncbi:tyrosinase cofactor [Streptomyces sp. NPDC052687]|uniref:apotyrosinase chaperone MelC1 n=1 Tax=Streptomyces sp. NPDC052687 TaxID=3154759 RepID=UPI0034444D5F